MTTKKKESPAPAAAPAPTAPAGAPDPWAHRSAGMRCVSCMWFVAKAAPDDAGPPLVGLGRCRKHAPTMGGYPAVYEDDWCGDHRLAGSIRFR